MVNVFVIAASIVPIAVDRAGWELRKLLSGPSMPAGCAVDRCSKDDESRSAALFPAEQENAL
jgi:hypothetical protein